MRKLIISGLCSVSLLIGLAYAQENGNSEETNRAQQTTETIVYPIRNAAAEQLTATLLEFFEGSDIRVVAEPTNNMLLLRVPAGSRKEVLEVLEQVDGAARSMLVELHLLKSGDDGATAAIDTAQFSGPTEEVRRRIAALETDGKLYAANSMHLTVVDNQKALLQVGKTVAVVTGSTSFGGARQMNAYQDRHVGTLMTVQAVASDDGGISISLQFEKSEVLQGKPVSEDEQPIPASTATMTHQSTVQVKDGQSVLVGRLVGRSGNQATGAYLVVGAKLLQQSGEMVSFRSFSRSEPLSPSGLGARTASSSTRGFGAFGASSSSSRRSGSSEGSPPRSASSRPRSTSGNNRYEQYAAGLVRRYDTDGDSKLNAEERKQMSRQYTEADADKDGLLTVEELVKALQRR